MDYAKIDHAKNAPKGMKFISATGNGVRNYQWTGTRDFDADTLAKCFALIEVLDKRVLEVMMFETAMTSTLGTVDDILNSWCAPEFWNPDRDGVWGAEISRLRTKGVLDGFPLRLKFISQDKDVQVCIYG